MLGGPRWSIFISIQGRRQSKTTKPTSFPSHSDLPLGLILAMTSSPETIVRACCIVTLSFGSVVFSPPRPYLISSIHVSTSAIARHRQPQRPAIAPPAITLGILNFSAIREHGLGSFFFFFPFILLPLNSHVGVITYVRLEYSAGPNISNSRSKTPFDVASRLEILQLLSSYRAKPISL